jgi:hypothetical protein
VAHGITHHGIVRATPSKSLYIPKVTDKLRVRIKNKSDRCVVDNDLIPHFTIPPSTVDREYRTIFGPYFNIPELRMPGQSVADHQIAIQRMISVRKPEIPGLHDELISLQFKSQRKLRAGMHAYKKWFYQRVEYAMRDLGYPTWVFKKHAKRKLRVLTDELIDDMGNDSFKDFDTVSFKLKNFELLPKNKKRGIGDLSAVRTNATAWCFDYIKSAMAGVYTHGTYDFEFVATPDIHKLKEVFENLIAPVASVYFVYFSDDCCVSARCKDGIVYFNGDISQCDGSHFTTLDVAQKLFNTNHKGEEHCFSSTVDRAYNYLYNDLKFVNKFDRREKVRYRFTSKRMYSGFAGTTVTNNVANLRIGLMLQSLCPDPLQVTKLEFQALYVEAAKQCGYIVKVVPCDKPEDLQFLKMSPSVVDGVVTPYMNIGVHLRGFGTFPYDLPARGSVESRARVFNSDVVKSRIHWGNHEIYTSFRRHIVESKIALKGSVYAASFETKVVGLNNTYIPLESIAKRYGCSVFDLQELCECIEKSGLGDVVHLPVLSLIYNKDYG